MDPSDLNLPDPLASSVAVSPLPARLPARRRWAFRLLALALPLVVLALVEGGFRIAGYGGYPPILKEVGAFEGKAYVVTLDEGVRPFFSANPLQTGSMDEQVFTMPKDAKTVRIFVVGESAAQGYPQPRPLKFASFLQAMLADRWPQRNVEIINLSTTAVASFPVVHLARAALDYDPDLVIVYCGNNEYYGAGGVASTHALGRTALAMQIFHELGRSALIQGLRAGRKPTVVIGGDRTLMDVVIADAQIPPNDSRREAAAQNLADNLTRIVASCRARGVPVILCTCPGSERNLAPIGEDLPPPLAQDDANRFDALLHAGTAERTFAPARALAALDEAAGLYGKHARLQFLRAQCLEALGRDEEAAEAFWLARDLDPMPWRSPRLSNEAIRKTAKNGAVLCDLERAFQRASPGGIIGWELMDDHVHPSLQGQALVAQTVLDAMVELSPPLQLPQGTADQLPNWESYAHQLGANPVDAYAVTTAVTDLFERPFFRRSNPDALVRSQAQRRRIIASMSPDELRAVRQYEERRSGGPLTGAVGEAEFLAGHFRVAARYCDLGRRTQPQFAYLAVRYGCLELESRRRSGLVDATEERLALERIEHQCRVFHMLRPYWTPRLNALHGWVLGRLGRHGEAIQWSEPAIHQLKDPLLHLFAGQLVTDYVAVGRVADARTLIDKLHLSLAELGLTTEVQEQLASPW